LSGVEIRFTTFLNIYIGTYIFVQVGFSYLFIHFVWQNKRYYFSIKLTHGARTAPLWGRYLRGIYVHSLYVGWNDIIKFFFFFISLLSPTFIMSIVHFLLRFHWVWQYEKMSPFGESTCIHKRPPLTKILQCSRVKSVKTR